MIAIVGLGFVGLTTALGFCEKGFKVYGIEEDSDKRESLISGKIPFFEPELDDALTKHLNKNFFIEPSVKDVLSQSEIVFYCVGTPSDHEGAADISYLKAALGQTLDVIDDDQYRTLVIKSTVPPSTAVDIFLPMVEKSKKNLGFANNPEFLREGSAFTDFLSSDRIVIGSLDSKSADKVAEIYKRFNVSIFKTSLNTAEFIKYLSNALLATMISFSNDMALLGDAIGDIDIRKTFEALHCDRRWSGDPANMSTYFHPGCGFGGSCLPKDTRALNHLSKAVGHPSVYLEAASSVNIITQKRIVSQITKMISPQDTIGVLGLSFKPNTDDVRESPALNIINGLVNAGFKNIIAYDPMANDTFAAVCTHKIEYLSDFKSVVERADITMLLTSWSEFIENNEYLLNKKILDFRYTL